MSGYPSEYLLERAPRSSDLPPSIVYHRTGRINNLRKVRIMAEIRVADNGPLAATGVTVLDGEGKKIKDGQVFLCRCGLSEKKPFCDGSHSGKFESVVRA